MKRSTIKDNSGFEWVVEIDELFGDKTFPITLANFYVFHPANYSKVWEHPIGHGNLSIQAGNKTEAKLEDLEIDSNLENKGIGSSLLMLIEIWVKNHGVNKIIGDLSDVDADHLGKLKHFYNKHGYIFRLHNTGKKGASIMVGEVEKSIS